MRYQPARSMTIFTVRPDDSVFCMALSAAVTPPPLSGPTVLQGRRASLRSSQGRRL
ncbi:MAG: hypothetical protein MZV70_66070 [Desulfobacterales bacterium]|nr:hypothetical protein [Desulfobacterales bacterium]